MLNDFESEISNNIDTFLRSKLQIGQEELWIKSSFHSHDHVLTKLNTEKSMNYKTPCKKKKNTIRNWAN